MKIIKHIPEAQLAVAELDDGTRLTISADSLAAAEQIARSTDEKRKLEKAEKKAEKEAEKEADKADKELAKLAKEAEKAVPAVLAHLAAIRHRDSAAYLPDLLAAVERLV